MQIHHRGYVSGDPRVKEAAGYGIDLAPKRFQMKWTY